MVADADPSPFGLALYHLLRLDLDAAADAYELAIARRDWFAALLAAAEFTKPLRNSPRWSALAKQMNL